MIENSELHRIIKDLCDKHSLYLEESREQEFRIYTDYSSGITIFLKLEKHSNLSFYFLQRTLDVVYHGDRTDVHVALSLMFSSFLRIFDLGISSSLFDIPHPIIPDEIWGRYIMPEQTPILFGINSKKKLVEVITKIIAMTAIWREILWQNIECPCEECFKKVNIDNTRGYDIPMDIETSMELLYKSNHINFGSRVRPNWDCYYDMKNEVTIIKSKGLSNFLRFALKLKTQNTTKIDGINGKLLLDGDIKNYIDSSTLKELNSLIKVLIKNKSKIYYNIIPLENMVITTVKDYIIALGRLAGRYEFKKEREQIRKRHNLESKFLFPVPEFEWMESVCPDQFEGLIKALLEREPNVVIVRKPAPINQSDKGRDLLIEWNVLDANIISDETPPTSSIKFVGQCKTGKKTIGKNKVQDIRDTLETHNSNGYFLAVNTQISAPLTEKLEELKDRGFWIEWWNKEEIESRLSNNQDLIPLFPKVIKAKSKIKFIEK